MKKALLFAILCLLTTCPMTFAVDDASAADTAVKSVISEGDFSPQIIEKIKAERNAMYNALNLTSEQIKQKDDIEVRRYIELAPALKKLCLDKKRLKELSGDKAEENEVIASVKKDITEARKEIRAISKKYDKEFKKILNREQKSKYSMMRKLKRAEYKKIKKQKRANKNSSLLRPFGVPISQSDYTKSQKSK